MEKDLHDLIERAINEQGTDAQRLVLEKLREAYFWLLMQNQRIPGPRDRLTRKLNSGI